MNSKELRTLQETVFDGMNGLETLMDRTVGTGLLEREEEDLLGDLLTKLAIQADLLGALAGLAQKKEAAKAAAWQVGKNEVQKNGK